MGGSFTQAGPVAANRVAAWDGTQWSAFGMGIGDGTVWGLAGYNGDLYAAGQFDTTGAGVSAVNLARWDGMSWQAITGSPPGGANTIWGAYSDQNYFYCSTYTSGPFQAYLNEWDGSSWSSHPVPSGLLPFAYQAYQGKLYMTGSGGFSGFLLWWDGSSFGGPGEVFNNDALSLGIHDGLLYVGGSWNIPGPPGTQYGVSAWDGADWVPLNTDFDISVEAIQSLNGRLIIGGDFGVKSYDGSQYIPMASTNLYYVHAMELYQGKLYVTGLFDHVGTTESYFIGAWNDPTVGIDGGGLPAASRLQVSNYPNPFNPTTTVRVVVPEKGLVDAAIYDVQGRLVRTLDRGMRNPGALFLTWDGHSNTGNAVGSGVYFLRVQAGSNVATRKIVLLK